MSFHIFLVTHDHIGQELLNTVGTMVDLSQVHIQTISIPSDITAAQRPEFSLKVNSTVTLSSDNDILILCDIYGATPFNLIKKLSQQDNTHVITGLNLGMLLKAVQITQKPLSEAALEIVQSAQKSIILE